MAELHILLNNGIDLELISCFKIRLVNFYGFINSRKFVNNKKFPDHGNLTKVHKHMYLKCYYTLVLVPNVHMVCKVRESSKPNRILLLSV